MIGRVGSSRDSSFLCLVAIYLAHLVLFHVFDVAPRLVLHSAGLGRRTVAGNDRAAANLNSTSVTGLDSPEDASPASGILTGQLPHEMFARNPQFHWDSPMDHSMTSYPKIDFDILFLLTWITRVNNIFATIALSSSTWGIISGCAIFLLTYTDRDNTP